MPRFVQHASIGSAVACLVLCAGCGSGSTSACGADVPAAVAAVVGAHHAQGEAEADSDGYARCLFKATGPHGGTPEGMRVTVNSGSRAYVGFTTTIVHLVQFPSAGAQPIGVNGLGKDADWVPGPRTLLAATNSRFVTIKVLSHGTGSPPDRAAAIRVARAALR